MSELSEAERDRLIQAAMDEARAEGSFEDVAIFEAGWKAALATRAGESDAVPVAWRERARELAGETVRAHGAHLVIALQNHDFDGGNLVALLELFAAKLYARPAPTEVAETTSEMLERHDREACAAILRSTRHRPAPAPASEEK